MEHSYYDQEPSNPFDEPDADQDQDPDPEPDFQTGGGNPFEEPDGEPEPDPEAAPPQQHQQNQQPSSSPPRPSKRKNIRPVDMSKYLYADTAGKGDEDELDE